MTEITQANVNSVHCRLNFTVSPNFRTLDFHAHDEYEILYFLSGEVQYYIEDKAYYLMPGDLLIIPPGKLHRPVIIDENITYERMVLMISPAYAASLLKPSGEHFENYAASPCRIPNEEVQSAEFQQMLYKILSLEKNSVGMLQRDCYATLILLSLIAFIKNTPVQEDGPKVRMQQVIHYINAHFTEPLKLDDIADRFYLSKYHLLRQFKAYANSTIHNYILVKRVVLAKKLLLKGHSPREVSTLCGFGSYAGFYQAFVQSTGESPMQFSKKQK